MKPIRLRVVHSTTRRGFLSLRLNEGDETATALYRALTESGAQPGDLLELRLVEPEKATKPVGHGWSCACGPCETYKRGVQS